jgi:hypothetical protein
MCFAPRPSERSKLLQPSPRFLDKPLERTRTSQLGPWPRGTAGSPEFRQLRPRSRAGSGSGSSRGSPRTYWWPGLGQGCRRRGLRWWDGLGWTMHDPGGALGPRGDARGAGWKGDGRRRWCSGGGGNGAARRGWRLGQAWEGELGALLYVQLGVTAGW